EQDHRDRQGGAVLLVLQTPVDRHEHFETARAAGLDGVTNGGLLAGGLNLVAGEQAAEGTGDAMIEQDAHAGSVSGGPGVALQFGREFAGSEGEHRDRELARDPLEIAEELGETVALAQIVKERLDGDSRATEHRLTDEPLGIDG